MEKTSSIAPEVGAGKPKTGRSKLFAAILAGVSTAVTGCVEQASVANGGGVSVSSSNGKTNVHCEPTYTSGPNAHAGHATASVNGKTYECQDDGTVVEK
jgi:hypothetical protein